MVWFGRLGWECYGEAGRGRVRHGRFGRARAYYGMVRYGMAGVVCSGEARRGVCRCGKVRLGRYGAVYHGGEWQARYGTVC